MGLKICPIVATAMLTASAMPLMAADHQIRMLNRGTDGAMVFEPGFTKIAPGDTVTFIPVDKGHNVETFKGLIPKGAPEFKSKANEEYRAKLDMPGAYVVKCTPHMSLGMVALIQVGDSPTNLDAIKTATVPNLVRKRLDADLAQIAE
ncbi:MULTISPECIES: pseudoazurin [Rhizobium]|uniref:Pseudoazurin n=3 Tax=Rhizobium TaxID=379 RepID=A0A6P1CGI7_RHITR|nr:MULTISPECIES: pseudoazurin [Rhizobium]AGB73502.1 putative copper binding protein, plastocyanin/azurin family [Rhizobium tropici CIAT 899]AYG70429.1 pseudoazurin [Rhizobium sp. CCGE531]AYG76946.1 pseudoazurin [Rhizobium sp. CCGE532]ENN84761.1 putative copper binding protein, plastocyanin/azurin family [Rhizobium freirei PRF 81]MBB4244881.1 pseudoazurin [Rhizobium tropici]